MRRAAPIRIVDGMIVDVISMSAAVLGIAGLLALLVGGTAAAILDSERR